MTIKVFKTKEELYSEVYEYYLKRLNKQPNITLGLATGSTPIPLYEKLINGYNEKKVSFKEVTTFNLDEYVGIDSGHEQSYIRFMKEKLFGHVDININNCFIPSGENEKLEESRIRYQELLNNHTIDLQLLGIGSNGHIGFNEPGTPFDSKVHIIELDEKTRIDNSRLFNSLDEVPTHAITMGIKDIMNAKEIIVIATGENKADAVFGMIEGPIDTDLPASILQKHPNVVIYLDEDAASKLSKERK